MMNNGRTLARFQAAGAIAVILVAGWTASVSQAQFLENNVRLLQTFTGEAAFDEFGWVTDAIGDLNNDGITDFLVSAPGNDFAGNNAGRVYVYSGATGEQIYTFEGNPGERLGTDVGDAGDVDNDGVTDVILGAQSLGAGRIYLFSGADGSLIRVVNGEAAGDNFGASVGSVGDVNGDQHDDVIVGAPRHDTAGINAGRVYVISGADGSIIDTVDGESSGDRFGSAINGLGDVSGDEIGDFVVGAQHAGPAGRGRAYVYSGATRQLVYPLLAPDATGVDFGLYFVASPGDVNNDGTPDVYVSDFSDSSGTGKAYVFDGTDGSRIHVFSGAKPGQGFGIGRGAGDVNHDGYDDLLLASWSSSLGGSNAGMAQIFSGRDASLLRTITSTTAGETFGFDANAVGDVDGDGEPDFVISAAWNNAAGTRAGRVYLIAGNRLLRPGDLNCDGVFNGGDIDPFFLALGDPPGYVARFPKCNILNGDMNGDGAVNGADIDAFFACLGGVCP
ncbi:MAG: FG-GAP repeat protein [Planctomycetes bacterium]|nr:FG-GAP repeat protein [Planctomycetota bacterium]